MHTFETPSLRITTTSSSLPQLSTITGRCQNASCCRERSAKLRTPHLLAHHLIGCCLESLPAEWRRCRSSTRKTPRGSTVANSPITIPTTSRQSSQIFHSRSPPSLFSMNRNQNQMPNHPVILSGAIIVVSVAVAVSYSPPQVFQLPLIIPRLQLPSTNPHKHDSSQKMSAAG